MKIFIEGITLSSMINDESFEFHSSQMIVLFTHTLPRLTR
jgi:hypothetical protein